MTLARTRLFSLLSGSSPGASLVEFALVIPVLVLLLVGVIEVGPLYNDAISARSGVRTGARHAAVGDVGADDTCTLYPPSSNPAANHLMCLTKKRIGIGGDRVRVAIAYGPSGYGVGQPVAVCAQFALRSVTGLFAPMFSGQFMQTKVEMRIQTASSSPPGAAQESPPSGGSWDFCRVTT